MIVSPKNAAGLTLVKLTGFGLSERVNNNASYETSIPGGSVNWSVPELILKKLGVFPILGPVIILLLAIKFARSNWKNQLTNWHTNLNELV